MSDAEFRRLLYVTRVVDGDTLYFNQAHEWEEKRKSLLLQLADIPSLLEAHTSRPTKPYPLDPKISLVDFTPTLRLANACEATANCLYSVAEIASNFANKASKGAVPASFNALRKRCEAEPGSPIAQALGDLQWYMKVRELRTEWTHYSSVFIGAGSAGEAMICVRSYRRASDKTEFITPNFSCTVDQLVLWVREALTTLDTFAGYVLRSWILPKFRLDQTFITPVLDRNGFPVMKTDYTFEVETITIQEYFRRGGIGGA